MHANSQPLVSVITPAYNEEEHLAECIESVLAQTYQHWDYTIVNNCSTDQTLEIARSYAAKDPRIRVHDNVEFLPMLANHNLAIQQISPSSKYCKMVLADDWIYPDCLEKMVAVAEKYPSVGAVSSYQLHGQQVRSVGLPYNQNVVSGREACRLFLLGTLALFGTQNSVLFRTDLVKNRDPFFVETDICADFEACFALLQKSELGFVHQVLTFSRVRPDSFGAVTYDLGAHFGSSLNLLLSYGKYCLTEAEFRHRLKHELSAYYDFLGRRWWVERDRGFWSYHKKTFSALGIQLSRMRLLNAAMGQLGEFVFHPGRTLESILRLLSLKRIRDTQSRSVVPNFDSQNANSPRNPVARPERS